MPPHDLTYKSSDIFSIQCLQVDKGVMTSVATGQLLWMILNTFSSKCKLIHSHVDLKTNTQFVLSFTSWLESNVSKRYLTRFAM